MMLVLAGHLSPTAHAASVIVAGARTAGIDALPLLRTVQGMGLRLGPGEFRALVDDDTFQIDTVRTLSPCAAVPRLRVITCQSRQGFTQELLSGPYMAAKGLMQVQVSDRSTHVQTFVENSRCAFLRAG